MFLPDEGPATGSSDDSGVGDGENIFLKCVAAVMYVSRASLK